MTTDFPNRPARPWDLYNKKIGRVIEVVAKERLETCKGCEHYISLTSQCKKCGCVMFAKTKLPNAECPIGKWGMVNVDQVIDKENTNG
jgi:hypothetical protein